MAVVDWNILKSRFFSVCVEIGLLVVCAGPGNYGQLLDGKVIL